MNNSELQWNSVVHDDQNLPSIFVFIVKNDEHWWTTMNRHKHQLIKTFFPIMNMPWSPVVHSWSLVLHSSTTCLSLFISLPPAWKRPTDGRISGWCSWIGHWKRPECRGAWWEGPNEAEMLCSTTSKRQENKMLLRLQLGKYSISTKIHRRSRKKIWKRT